MTGGRGIGGTERALQCFKVLGGVDIVGERANLDHFGVHSANPGLTNVTRAAAASSIPKVRTAGQLMGAWSQTYSPRRYVASR